MKPLRIAINISDLFSKVPGGGGQGTVLRVLIGALTELDRENRYTLFSIRRMIDPPAVLKGLPANFRVVHLSPAKPQVTLLAWHLLRWPPIERFIGEQDVVHVLSPSLVPPCRQARLVLTVNDLVCWRFPEGLMPWGRFFIRKGMLIGVREAACITTISEATRQDLLAYLPNRIDPNRVRTVHIAADPSLGTSPSAAEVAAVAEKHGVRNAYLISIGTVEPRKNLPRLLRAYAMLDPQVRERYTLLIIGPHGWKMPVPQTLITSLGLAHQVVWTGYVSEADRNALLRGATALVYPSLYEGFGLPILEAMVCGVPVIASNTSSMLEVAGDAALFVDPLDTAAIAQGLQRVLEDPALRQGLIERGRAQCRLFSDQKMASEFLAIYHSIAERTWEREGTGCQR